MAKDTDIQVAEYDAILRQAVAVIDRTRTMVATTICSAIGSAHWEIGKLLHDRKLESKHGSGVVNRLSYDLKLSTDGRFFKKSVGYEEVL